MQSMKYTDTAAAILFSQALPFTVCVRVWAHICNVAKRIVKSHKNNSK